jgi:hypothetical protein
MRICPCDQTPQQPPGRLECWTRGPMGMRSGTWPGRAARTRSPRGTAGPPGGLGGAAVGKGRRGSRRSRIIALSHIAGKQASGGGCLTKSLAPSAPGRFRHAAWSPLPSSAAALLPTPPPPAPPSHAANRPLWRYATHPLNLSQRRLMGGPVEPVTWRPQEGEAADWAALRTCFAHSAARANCPSLTGPSEALTKKPWGGITSSPPCFWRRLAMGSAA